MGRMDMFNVSEAIKVSETKTERFCHVCRWRETEGVKELKLGDTIIPLCQSCRDLLSTRLAESNGVRKLRISRGNLRADTPPDIVKSYEEGESIDRKWLLSDSNELWVEIKKELEELSFISEVNFSATKQVSRFIAENGDLGITISSRDNELFITNFVVVSPTEEKYSEILSHLEKAAESHGYIINKGVKSRGWNYDVSKNEWNYIAE